MVSEIFSDNEINSDKIELKRVNPYLNINKFKRKTFSIKDEFKKLLAGDTIALGKAITLIESSNPYHKKKANNIIKKCLPYSGKSIRIGITGVPGVGKSTFIETLGLYLINEGHKVAVLTIDPSSEISKGSILGDKIRMENLSKQKNAFIRSTPSGGNLGGVARTTRETMLLCEAAGFDIIIIETLGVGQSETTIKKLTDVFVLLVLPNSGDEIQGIKRGIMEMSDFILITKADGDNLQASYITYNQMLNIVNLLPKKDNNWTPKVILTSAKTNLGIKETWSEIYNYINYIKQNNFFYENRKKQNTYWMMETLNNIINQYINNNKKIKKLINKLEKKLENNKISPFEAAEYLFLKIFKS